MKWLSHPVLLPVLILVPLAVIGASLAAPVAPAAAERWDARLEELRPDRPLAYFELAEEIADAAADAEEADVARHLFRLAGVLAPERFGRSACLALADMETDANEKRRLLALANLLSTQGWTFESEAGRDAIDPDAAMGIARAFSYYRQGKGTRALAELRAEGAEELFGRFEFASFCDLDRFRTDCKAYRGRTRPVFRDRDIARMLRFEAGLLGGIDRPWSSDLALSRGRTLVEVDPARLAETLGVDPDRTLYRDGTWIRVADAGGP